jgi:hypothetical protein
VKGFGDVVANDNHQAVSKTMIDPTPIDPNMIDPAKLEANRIESAILEPAPGLRPAELETWIRQMSRATNNPVERALLELGAWEASFQLAIYKILNLLLERIMFTIPVESLGTRCSVRVTSLDLRNAPSGTDYKDTTAYSKYVARFPRVTSREEGDQEVGTIEPWIEEVLVSVSGVPERTGSIDSTDWGQVGPIKTDLCVVADDSVTRTVIIFAFIEIKFSKPAGLKGTRLESPSSQTSLALGEERYEPLDSETKLTLKQGAAQMLWHGCVITEMQHTHPAVPAGQPVLGMFMINGWFVRAHFSGNTVLVESDARAGGSCSLTDFVRSFKEGDGFRHHLGTHEGAAAMCAYMVAAASEVVPPSLGKSRREEEMVEGELEASVSESVQDHNESDSICETSPDRTSPIEEVPQALEKEDFDGTDATEYAATQEPEKLVELMIPAWAIKFCLVEEFDRVLKRV